MHFCPNCGLMAPDPMTRCPQCGAALPPPVRPADDPAALAGPHYTPAQPEPSGAMTTGAYFLTLLVYLIPVVGVVVALVWAFGNNTNVARRNLSRAYLLRMALAMLLGLFAAIFVLAALIFLLGPRATSGFGGPYYIW